MGNDSTLSPATQLVLNWATQHDSDLKKTTRWQQRAVERLDQIDVEQLEDAIYDATDTATTFGLANTALATLENQMKGIVVPELDRFLESAGKSPRDARALRAKIINSSVKHLSEQVEFSFRELPRDELQRPAREAIREQCERIQQTFGEVVRDELEAERAEEAARLEELGEAVVQGFEALEDDSKAVLGYLILHTASANVPVWEGIHGPLSDFIDSKSGAKAIKKLRGSGGRVRTALRRLAENEQELKKLGVLMRSGRAFTQAVHPGQSTVRSYFPLMMYCNAIASTYPKQGKKQKPHKTAEMLDYLAAMMRPQYGLTHTGLLAELNRAEERYGLQKTVVPTK